MVSVCTVPARGGRSCERFGGYKTINRIPLPLGFPYMDIKLLWELCRVSLYSDFKISVNLADVC